VQNLPAIKNKMWPLVSLHCVRFSRMPNVLFVAVVVVVVAVVVAAAEHARHIG